jgi:Na+/proline symporter
LPAALSIIDYGVLGLVLALVLGVAIYFSTFQRDTAEFFLGGQRLHWFGLGVSLATTLASLLTLPGLAGLSYEQGLKTLLIPAAAWLILPVVVGLVAPLFRGLRITSLGEYLELRFDGRVRLAGGVVMFAWRLVWCVALLVIAARAMVVAAGWAGIPDWSVIFLLGLAATLCAFLGGLRAVVWSDLLLALVIVAGAAVVIVAVWSRLDDGPERVREVAQGLGRMQVVDLRLDWGDGWTLWAALPHWTLWLLALVIADQSFVQRLLSAKSVNVARTAYVIAALAATVLVPTVIYCGLCLLAFYYDHPQALEPRWVVNLDGRTRQPLKGADGRPLLDESNPAHDVRWENIDRLVAERRLLKPNNKEPFTDAEALVEPETNRVLVEKLAMRRPPRERLNGEWVVRRGAPGEMLPQFMADHLPWGAAGLAVAALAAAALAGLHASMCSLGTLASVDFVRRFGVGRAWLARRLGKEAAAWTPADELRFARPLVLVVGGVATLSALVVSFAIDDFARILLSLPTLAAPLLAVFLLGMVTRRATSGAALLALTLGIAVAGGVELLAALGKTPFASAWNAPLAFLATWSAGYVLSFVAGRRKSNADLRGLVAGCGTLGVRSIDEVTPIIPAPDSRFRF